MLTATFHWFFLSLINPILTPPVCFLGMNFNTILLSMLRSFKQFLSFRVSPPKPFENFSPIPYVTNAPKYSTALDLINLRVLVLMNSRSYYSASCSFLQRTRTSSFMVHTSTSHLCSQIPSVCALILM